MNKLSSKRIHAKAVIQYEAAECGAASLAIILRYFGKIVPLSELRKICGVNRDGSNAKQILKASRFFGLEASAYRCSGEEFQNGGKYPAIIFWGFNHFLVVEGFDEKHAYLSDPGQGRVKVLMEEFLDKFTGVVLEFNPGKDFSPGGVERSPLWGLIGELKPFRNQVLTLLLIATVFVIPTLMIAGLTSTFVDGFLQNEHYYFGIPIVWLMLLCVVTMITLQGGQYLILRRMELILSKQITSRLFKKLFAVAFAFHQARLPGEISSRMLLGMNVTQVLISQLVRFCINIWVAIMILAFAASISISLTSLVLVVMVGNLYLNWWLTNIRYDSNRKLALEQGKAVGKGLQGINNIETIKASGLENDFLSQWQGSFGNVVIQNQVLGSQLAYSTITASSSTFLLSALIICFGGLLIIKGSLTLGSLVAFQFLQGRLTAPINSLPQINSTLQRLIGDLGRLDDLWKNENDHLVRSFSSNSYSRPTTSTTATNQEKLSGSIELKGVEFGFNKTDPPFLSEINLNIPKGTQLSIVGGSGSGKTTLIRLIAGLYEPLRGEILFDGSTWLDYPDNLIRKEIAYVPQQVFVFNASIWDNLTLWNPDYQLDDLLIAAKDSQIYSTITSHPEAFQRKMSDNGSDLSGGERQRMELCRALLRNPSMILLDEATSALDNATQSLIFEALRRRSITVINVAHRLDSAIKSDQIIVMEHGKIVEHGKPQILLEQEGYFTQLVKADPIAESILQ